MVVKALQVAVGQFVVAGQKVKDERGRNQAVASNEREDIEGWGG